MALARLIRGGAVLPTVLALAALGLSGCGEGEAPEEVPAPEVAPGPEVPAVEPGAGPPDVGAEARALEADLTRSLERLLEGPSREEREAGRFSWFSRDTAGMLRSVRVDQGGRAVVDFGDLRPVIPGASSSAGSEALLEELNRAVFRFPEVVSVEYRIEGSCAAFWEWLQYDCQVVYAPGG